MKPDPDTRGTYVTRYAFILFVIWFLLLAGGVAFTVFDQVRLEQERHDRNRQVNLAFLTNCRNRESEVAKLNRRVGLPSSHVRCSTIEELIK